jgi:hypothetical protein
MDRPSEARKRNRAATSLRRQEARARGILPCGCVERALSAAEDRQRNPWAKGFRKGVQGTWAVLAVRVCEKHREEI